MFKNFSTHTVHIDNAPDFQFKGERIAKVSSALYKQKHPTRWTELALYKTKSGKYVCHQAGITTYEDEHTIYSGTVCEDEEEVKNFFGHRWLAKELYKQSGINYVEIIE